MIIQTEIHILFSVSRYDFFLVKLSEISQAHQLRYYNLIILCNDRRIELYFMSIFTTVFDKLCFKRQF